MYVDMKTYHKSSYFLPSFLPAYLLSFFPSDIMAFRLFSCLAIQQGHQSFWCWRYFQENARVFSYWKKLDLIRNLETSFTRLWSLWIWQLLCCHWKTKIKIYILKKTFLRFQFFINKMEWKLYQQKIIES